MNYFQIAKQIPIKKPARQQAKEKPIQYSFTEYNGKTYCKSTKKIEIAKYISKYILVF